MLVLLRHLCRFSAKIYVDVWIKQRAEHGASGSDNPRDMRGVRIQPLLPIVLIIWGTVGGSAAVQFRFHKLNLWFPRPNPRLVAHHASLRFNDVSDNSSH